MRRGVMNGQRSVTKRWVRVVVSWRTLQQGGEIWITGGWPLQQDQTCKSLSQGEMTNKFPSDLFWNLPISVISPLFMKYKPVFTKPLSCSFLQVSNLIAWDCSRGHLGKESIGTEPASGALSQGPSTRRSSGRGSTATATIIQAKSSIRTQLYYMVAAVGLGLPIRWRFIYSGNNSKSH